MSLHMLLKTQKHSRRAILFPCSIDVMRKRALPLFATEVSNQFLGHIQSIALKQPTKDLDLEAAQHSCGQRISWQTVMVTKIMASPLSAFLSSTRAASIGGLPTLPSYTTVLGNSSADLDSFISAVVYAYFCSSSLQNGDQKRLFIPVLNLPSTPTRDLWRLRPEFGTVLKLAQRRSVPYNSREAVKDGNHRALLELLLTICDIRSASKSIPKSLSSDLSTQSSSEPHKKDEYVLVDHNALSIPTVSTETLQQYINVTGCIDHHADESFVPSNASPRIIKTGVGSCTSLVVQHLRDSRLWPLPEEGLAMGELARLALASILIDTVNMTAEDKVSGTDRDAVAFLESCIRLDSTAEFEQQEWDRKSFYDEIANTKAKSLNLLSLHEIFDHDYKEWVESTKDGEKLKIGISSIVKPITWLLEKAARVDDFLDQVHTFAHGSDHDLALFGIMTTSTSESGHFQRELLIVAYGPRTAKALKDFESTATRELDLKPWDENAPLLNWTKATTRETDELSRIWWQQDVTRSRKQVAPLLRNLVKGC